MRTKNKLQVIVTFTDRKTGKVIATTTTEEFMNAMRAPQTSFLRTMIDEYNNQGKES
jgi:hypothetical protein